MSDPTKQPSLKELRGTGGALYPVVTPLAECAAWHEGQAQSLRSFLRLPMMLTESRPVLEADIAFHERCAVACREADGGEMEIKTRAA